ncbi:MAG: ABC transporter ATP-binding protein [Deltaproteobacteria bacterium]|nr:ABC transporter ATP-binding protein [Deltaproteobacteria bacterium]MBW1963247.1 ABC transporter ATP-binding protein [Deltaproteobacteria bacterium]MBW2153696.1 ABC transporter ATP-binding protein [Deltaproteobacteria bacterium]
MKSEAIKVLNVKDLTTCFFTDIGVATAVDRISFSVSQGDTLGIVGESGCGKSVTALTIMQLIPQPPGKIASGQVIFDGIDLLQLPDKQMRQIRGRKISMIFQDPMTSLNPVFKVGDQISEVIRLHQKLSKKESLNRAVELFKRVGIPSPEKRVHEYPHQLSGGMRQRTMIAMAISCHPKLMIADEPTTALDVTIQAQILNVLQDLKENIGSSIILITHDLGVIAETAQNVIVMYAGKIVEYAPVEDLFENPCHPYTVGLMHSVPSLEQDTEKLPVIPGLVPSLFEIPPGCAFNNRCDHASKRCLNEEPPLIDVTPTIKCKCWLYH